MRNNNDDVKTFLMVYFIVLFICILTFIIFPKLN